MSEIVTIYKINCYSSVDPSREGESCSLLPWDDGDPGLRGEDDGGRDYVLPGHYTAGHTSEGLPAVFGEDGNPCSVMLHNGAPLLVDSAKKLAFLLEPVKKITTWRELCGMSRAELAKRLGVTQKELFEWENKEREPDGSTLRKIAEILGCSVSDLT